MSFHKRPLRNAKAPCGACFIPEFSTPFILETYWNDSREEIRDAKGRVGFQYQAGGVRAEVGRHWKGFDLLLPYNAAEAANLGERIFYHAHNHGFTTDRSVGLLVQGIEGWMTDHLRQAEKAGNLAIASNVVDGVPCVQLSDRGGFVLCLAPQFDWSIVQCNALKASGFRQFNGLWFPTRLAHEKMLKDLKGGFSPYREACEVHDVTKVEPRPDPSEWKIPEPKPGTWVKVAYPMWNEQWDRADGGEARRVTNQEVQDCVRFEHAFEWTKPLSEKEARIFEVSRLWRDPSIVRAALTSDVAQGEGCQAPLPFLSSDGQRIIWATYDPTATRLLRVGAGLAPQAVEGGGFKFQAEFVPERAEINLGEPLFVTFHLTNTGTRTFYLATGGDSRGVRSDRFQFWAVDAEGQPALDPHPHAAHFGGIAGPPPEIAPGKNYSERLYLPLWITFDRPGQFMIRARRVIQLLGKQDFSHDYALVHPLLADFKLTVRPKDLDHLGQRIEELAALLGDADSEVAARAARQLADTDDARVVPHLVRIVQQGKGDAMQWAVQGLGKHPGPEAAGALQKALHFSGDSSVRSRAAEAMARMKSDAAVDALVGALNDDSPWVRRDVANALGQLGRRRAVEPLKSHLSDPHQPTRLAAVEALHALGEPFNSDWVTSIIKSKDPAFQNAIWFVRRNAGTNAPVILIDCLDLASPSVTNYYNYALVWQIHACGGPKLTYHHDFQMEGTPDQIEENRRTLQALYELSRIRGQKGTE